MKGRFVITIGRQIGSGGNGACNEQHRHHPMCIMREFLPDYPFLFKNKTTPPPKRTPPQLIL